MLALFDNPSETVTLTGKCLRTVNHALLRQKIKSQSFVFPETINASTPCGAEALKLVYKNEAPAYFRRRIAPMPSNPKPASDKVEGSGMNTMLSIFRMT